MADIELVIKIDEETYKDVKKGKIYSSIRDVPQESVLAIANGIQLPKGHKRLIAEPTEEDIAKTVGGQNDFAECIRDAVRMVFVNAPTIIKADKESEG